MLNTSTFDSAKAAFEEVKTFLYKAWDLPLGYKLAEA